VPLSEVVLVVNPVELPEVVVLKLLGPVQLYDVNEPTPVTLPALSVSPDPTQRFVEDGVIDATVGSAFTVTIAAVLVALTQPGAE